jgi:hypothetical protein
MEGIVADWDQTERIIKIIGIFYRSRSSGSSMTSLPTPPKRRLIYKVSVLQREDWSLTCTTDSLDGALTEARSALATGRYQRVKVEQSFTDPSTNRAVATVIFDERGPPAPASSGISVRVLLMISVLLGVAMFFATRFFIRSYSG